jgi:hypothetical protein
VLKRFSAAKRKTKKHVPFGFLTAIRLIPKSAIKILIRKLFNF